MEPLVQILRRLDEDVGDGELLRRFVAGDQPAFAELVRRHTAGRYTVAFIGFAPGFAYLTGLDPLLRLPRLETPRVRVPAGSVAIADQYTGIYPRPCPGGWQLIGSTELAVWDVTREPPALLTPGTVVRFEAQCFEVQG